MIKKTMYCDRCGKECEHTRDGHGFRLIKHDYIIEQWIDSDPRKLDLCQSCYDSLAEWVELGKEQ